jgi:asparagine synthase (glutamine-hydrolysing)
MILGALGCTLSPAAHSGFIAHAGADTLRGAQILHGSQRIGAWNPQECVGSDAASGSWLAYSGHPLFDANGALGGAQRAPVAARLLALLEARSLAGLAGVDGQFAIVWWSAGSQSLKLISDRFGMESLYFGARGKQIVFATRARDVAAGLSNTPRISAQGLVEFLTHCYLPGTSTLYEGIERVPGGSVIEFSPLDGRCRMQSWYRLSFANPMPANEADITARYRELLEASVVRRLDASRAGVFLSGGMDSSSVATFASRHLKEPLRSFSFRCVGASFDESPYARQLAAELGTIHAEVDYGEKESLQAIGAVGAMDMPFCDIGIEIGTWLLAQSARSSVDYLLTGDGGDEMWASHPVYAAQKIMRWYDRMPIPRALRSGLVNACSLVRDSDKKRNLPVVLKRLLPEPAYPTDLMHYRWRMYYTAHTLRDLLVPELADAISTAQPFRSVSEAFEGYQGPDDGLSACLFSDYRTVSSFYFSRLALARSLGLEVRMPFYDREFVEFGARIPQHLKLEGIERTKRLFRVAMEGVLPDVINHRGDKLGHSVPFKNWLRESGPLNDAITSTLGAKSLAARGLFRPEAVQRMLAEHRSRRHNHSHRLWALFVLEQWFRAHMDTASVDSVVPARSRVA